jgi:hypothetical protein
MRDFTSAARYADSRARFSSLAASSRSLVAALSLSVANAIWRSAFES